MITPFHRLPDTDLLVWATSMSNVLLRDPARFFISQQMAESYADVVSSYRDRLRLAVEPGTRTSLAVGAKRTAREELLVRTRHLVAVISSNPDCSVEMREELGIGVPAPRRRAIPAPAHAPFVGIVGQSGATVDLRIHTADSHRNMGRDVAAAQVYTFIGDAPPEHGDQWHLAATTTRSRLRLTLTPAASAHTLWITCRFLNRRAQPGPWSQPKSINLPALNVLPSSSIGKLAA